MHLRISDHAWQRWSERVGPVRKKEISRMVRRKLISQLRLGLQACDREAFELEVFPDVVAVVAISDRGFWSVKTFRKGFPGESAGSTEIEEVKP